MTSQWRTSTPRQYYFRLVRIDQQQSGPWQTLGVAHSMHNTCTTGAIAASFRLGRYMFSSFFFFFLMLAKSSDAASFMTYRGIPSKTHCGFPPASYLDCVLQLLVFSLHVARTGLWASWAVIVQSRTLYVSSISY